MQLKIDNKINAVLCLSDGSYFFGKGIGKKGKTIGEICFNTATTGYQEIITDPSYCGQIITFTFPHIGNVGCNQNDLEAKNPSCKGIVIREEITADSNFRSEIDLNQWLEKNNLTGICGLDTRALTKKIRTNGAQNAVIYFGNLDELIDTEKLISEISSMQDLNGAELCSQVSTKSSYNWNKSNFSLEKKSKKYNHNYKVVVIDFGVKQTILGCLFECGFEVIVVPAKTSFEEILKHNPDGVFLSNGPGDPMATSQYASEVIRKILAKKIPIFGICMGHQLLSIAAGLKTEKMFQGHRGANHPVKNLQTGMVEVTSQNHGFCVSAENIPSNIEITHISLFDNTIEGIRLKDSPAFSVQYHPESSPGPHDSRYLFEQFISLIESSKNSSEQKFENILKENKKDLLKVKSILVIGSGPIVIGQACEFDYSGTQACKVLKEEGYRVILVNSNPATIMTDKSTADATYIEPITAEVVEKIIQKEKPEAILPTVGGQTALNCALEIWKKGILEKYNVKMIGAYPEAIEKAEDRRKFNQAMAKIGLEVPKNAVVSSMEEAMLALKEIGLPAIIRPSFTLGGSGGGIAHTEEEYKEIIANGLSISPVNEVLVDQSILGWKEYELEVIRDKNDNAIIVCSIENIDPMGVHTGDSITVAPALTLTDKEYQIMRNAAIAVLREIGVETGGSNVQFAVNPKDGKMVVIEMNPRVSRSSALASKATGFPIAKVAAKLAIGYTLDQIKNDITKVTPASFEPTIDYVVTKIPRFTFEKFNETNPILSSAMRSVGEAMSMGRSFAESIQKALCSMEVGLNGFNEIKIDGVDEKNSLTQNQKIIKDSLVSLSSDRLLRIAQALRYQISVEEINQITSYDFWFLREIKKIIDVENKLIKQGLPQNPKELFDLKKMGFCDERIAELTNSSAKEIRNLRKKFNINPVYKKVDTCSAEFAANANYMYSCYEGDGTNQADCESMPSDKKKIIILGGGPNRIGQGIEFDYTCVHAAFSLSKIGYETIMINCNPETVSTDYDTSNRLYFEPMTSEHVMEVIEKERSNGELIGVIVQFGGQTSLKLARYLDEQKIPILGTPYDKIDLAEDRERFKKLLEQINLTQPNNTICYKISEIKDAVEKIGYPTVIRPSNVLGGRAMEIVYDNSALEKYLKTHGKFILDGPILVDKFLDNAIEVDVDALCDGSEVFVAGVMQHIEEAGIHSGDSACSIPPYSLSEEIITAIKLSTEKLAKEIGVVGLMNVQYAVKNNEIYVIEVNPRASRTVPFVAKSTGINIANIASLLMVGKKLSEFNLDKIDNISKKYFSVKEVVLPFARFANVDTILGPEMKSTGEVMGIDTSFEIAFLKSQIAAGNKISYQGGNALISISDHHKSNDLIEIAQKLQQVNYKIYATDGTLKYLAENGIKNIEQINKEQQSGYNVLDLVKEKKIDLVINTTQGYESAMKSFNLRRLSLMNRVFYITTISAAKCFVNAAIKISQQKDFDVFAIQNL
jgi:carbamoyl-phosphate synthase large subunit